MSARLELMMLHALHRRSSVLILNPKHVRNTLNHLSVLSVPVSCKEKEKKNYTNFAFYELIFCLNAEQLIFYCFLLQTNRVSVNHDWLLLQNLMVDQSGVRRNTRWTGDW